jgi:hypothetical protein
MKKKLFIVLAVLCIHQTIQAQTFDQQTAYERMYKAMAINTNDPENMKARSGSLDLTRHLIQLNELTSDVVYCTWYDTGIPALVTAEPDDNNPQVADMWTALYEAINRCNYFLENATGTDSDTQRQKAEARFLRALFYNYAIDLWGDVPLLTSTAATMESRTTRSKVFEFIESELKAVTNILPASATYGRPSQGTAQLLLARLYLNAEVYTGTARWADAKQTAKQLTGSTTYQLASTYGHLFMGDNDTNGAQNEVLLPLVVDGSNTANWGNTTYLIASCYSTSDYIDNGMSQKWSGLILRNELLYKFVASPYDVSSKEEAIRAAGDDRCLMLFNYSNSIQSFDNGVKCLKYTNLRSDGSTPLNDQHADTDFPLMRLAEAYLIVAEADARVNGGTCGTEGLAALNQLRQRAHAATLSAATLSDIADEWAREFYMEGQRRSQLIRFDNYAGSSYTWEGKGSKVNNLMPIPLSIVTNYPGMTQNSGYEDFSKKPEGLAMNKPAFSTMTVDLSKFQTMKFSWQRPTNFDATENLSYQLQLATTEDFSQPIYTSALIENETIEVWAVKLYELLTAYGISDGSTATVYVRVSCHGSNSDVFSFKVLNHLIQEMPDTWYLVGYDIADGNWGNSVSQLGISNIPMYVDDGSGKNTTLTFTGYFGGQGFKAVRTLGSWSDQVSASGDYIGFFEGSNIRLNGYHTITMNPSRGEVYTTPLTDTPVAYSSISMIGDFNGWGSDLEMTQVAGVLHNWYAELELTADTYLKFRANKSWDKNWGSTDFPYGQDSDNGINANIPVKAGTYKVFFNDITGHYVFLESASGKLPPSEESKALVDHMYLNKEFGTIDVAPAAIIDANGTQPVAAIDLKGKDYPSLKLVAGNNSMYLNNDGTVSPEYLTAFMRDITDKTVVIDDNYTTTTFTAVVRGLAEKMDLYYYTESQPVQIRIREALAPVESAYYYIGDLTSWNGNDRSMPLTRVSDRLFRITISMPAGHQEWFKVMPESSNPDNDGFWSSLILPSGGNNGIGSGGFTIGDGTAWLIPSDSQEKTYLFTLDFTTCTYTLAELQLGDANSDGVVDVADVVAVVNYILNKPGENFNEQVADVNGDGVIDVADVVAVVNIILKGQS